MLDQLTIEDFETRVGEPFTVSAADGDALEITLASADRAPEHYARPGGRKPFSLIFHGPRSPYAPQGTWQVEHAELGALDLFLVPLGPEGEVMRYQAVFT